MKLFVYGTLKKGLRLNHYLSGSTFITNHNLMGYKLYEKWGIPFMVRTNNIDDIVKGEIWDIPEDAKFLSALDSLERMYKREEVTVLSISDMGFVKNERVSAYVFHDYHSDMPEVKKNSNGAYEF